MTQALRNMNFRRVDRAGPSHLVCACIAGGGIHVDALGRNGLGLDTERRRLDRDWRKQETRFDQCDHDPAVSPAACDNPHNLTPAVRPLHSKRRAIDHNRASAIETGMSFACNSAIAVQDI